MTFSSTRLSTVILGLLLLSVAGPAAAQNVPADFKLIGTAGGLAGFAEYATVRVGADGQGLYQRFLPDEPGTPALEENAFTLSAAELGQLWQAIQTNNFFGLPAETANDDIGDRTFAELIVTANGQTHAVTTENVALAGFDDIVATLNSLTPGDDDLVYDTSEPFTFTPTDVCERAGKWGPPLRHKPGLQAKNGAPGPAQLASVLNGEPHAGTVVGYRMTLEEAVSKGIASLSGKGEFFGDAVSISVDNSGNATSDRLSLTLYLEFWGPEATAANAQRAEQAIESEWNGKMTSDGKTLMVDVQTRVSPGGSEAPGTPGYHQIKMIESGTSSVSGGGTKFNINEGTGTGTWRTTGSLLDEMYAHEAGHLFGLPDRYVDYRKQDDGTWKRKGDDAVFTDEELAAEVNDQYPDLTQEQLADWLKDKRRFTPPVPGSEDDIMANKKKDPHQGDIDAIAAQAGVIIEVKPGTILANKDGSEQNFVITRNEEVFVPAGGNKTLDGLFAACIDHEKGIPSDGVGFDVAPALSTWNGIAAAPLLEQLVAFADAREAFCASDGLTQLGIWRITDNYLLDDPELNRLVDQYLALAGVELEGRLLDFPRMTNPNADNPGTTVLTPPELFVAEITASSTGVLQPGTTVTLSGALFVPSLENVSADLSWALTTTPTGSAAALSATQGETTSFTADTRGLFQVRLRADLSGGSVPGAVESFATFAAADARTETFESGWLETWGPFKWRTDAEAPWAISAATANTGRFSVHSGAIDDGRASRLVSQFEHAVAGALSFVFRASSEEGFDFLRFSIDGEERGAWSGEVDWTVFSVDLPAGPHTAVWSYEKDGSIAEGADRAWIDDVFFPEDAIFTPLEDADAPDRPLAYRLEANYPNPFNPATTIGYALPDAGHVTLIVYDGLGRQVAVLVDAAQPAGLHRARFDAEGLPSGVYVYELRAGAFRERRAMVLFR